MALKKSVLLYPLVTEKAVNLIEQENKLAFIVEPTATKTDVRKELEEQYSVKVLSVNILRDTKGRKRAIARLSKESKASEIAMKLGVI